MPQKLEELAPSLSRTAGPSKPKALNYRLNRPSPKVSKPQTPVPGSPNPCESLNRNRTQGKNRYKVTGVKNQEGERFRVVSAKCTPPNKKKQSTKP